MAEVFRSRLRPGRTFHRSSDCIRHAQASPLAPELEALSSASAQLLAGVAPAEMPWPCTSCALSATLLDLHSASRSTLRLLVMPWPVTDATEDWQLDPARLAARDEALDDLLERTPALVRTVTPVGEAVVCEAGADALVLLGMTWRTVVLDPDLPDPTPEAIEVFAALDVSDLPDLPDAPLARHLSDRERFLTAHAAVHELD